MGTQVAVTDFGATLASWRAMDRAGRIGDIVLGYGTLDSYVADGAYLGGTIGRYANRIAGAEFPLSSVKQRLTANNGRHHLHGGHRGFNKVLWSAGEFTSDFSVTFRYQSKDGEEGYPGKLSVEVKFALTPANELRIDYRAVSDRETIVNLTNHSYFNLRGTGTILDHDLMILADFYTPVDEELIPTGELRFVQNTPFDFRTPTSIGARIEQDDPQLRIAGGYDHNWVLRNSPDVLEGMRKAAQLRDPVSGRTLHISTTEPGIQFYSGNFLNSSIRGRAGEIYDRRSGLCLETQHFPDSPNHPEFPSAVLRPDAEYRSTTIYKLGFISDQD